MPNDSTNGRIGLRAYMEALQAANDRANAIRFDAILEKLDANNRDQKADNADHEERIRVLEKRGVIGNVADVALLVGTLIAGVFGWKATT